MTREEAIKWQEAFKKTYGNFPPEATEACDMAIEALKKQERKHGRWIETCVPDVYQCNHCKKPTKMDELCNSETLRDFCPNCGADMRGEQR